MSQEKKIETNIETNIKIFIVLPKNMYFCTTVIIKYFVHSLTVANIFS